MRYEKRGKQGGSRLLDEICALCGYERNYASKVLAGERPIVGSGLKRRGGSQPVYGREERAVLKAIWLAAEQPCGKRLKAALELWLPYYEKRKGHLSRILRRKLQRISPATIDRLLKPCRVTLGSRGRCGTRPGTLLRSQIPIRTEHWEVSGPNRGRIGVSQHILTTGTGSRLWGSEPPFYSPFALLRRSEHSISSSDLVTLSWKSLNVGGFVGGLFRSKVVTRRSKR